MSAVHSGTGDLRAQYLALPPPPPRISNAARPPSTCSRAGTASSAISAACRSPAPRRGTRSVAARGSSTARAVPTPSLVGSTARRGRRSPCARGRPSQGPCGARDRGRKISSARRTGVGVWELGDCVSTALPPTRTRAFVCLFVCCCWCCYVFIIFSRILLVSYIHPRGRSYHQSRRK